MAVTTTNQEYIFVYSEMQINKEKEINAKIGRDFVCGEVSIGNDRKSYSKIITPEMLNPMMALYPDLKIVYRGTRASTAYTEISTAYKR